MPSGAPVRRSDDDRGVATLVVDSPPTRNALGVEALSLIRVELASVADDKSVRAVVIAPQVMCSPLVPTGPISPTPAAQPGLPSC